MVLMSVSLACMSKSMVQTARHQTQGEGDEEMGGCVYPSMCSWKGLMGSFLTHTGECISPIWTVFISSDHDTCGR